MENLIDILFMDNPAQCLYCGEVYDAKDHPKIKHGCWATYCLVELKNRESCEGCRIPCTAHINLMKIKEDHYANAIDDVFANAQTEPNLMSCPCPCDDWRLGCYCYCEMFKQWHEERIEYEELEKGEAYSEDPEGQDADMDENTPVGP